MKGIFYATSTGNTELVANKIKEKLEDFELIDISSKGISKIEDCSTLILGTPTWGEGDLQDDWDDCIDQLENIDFSNKTVALFGLGDQEGYYDEFSNAMGTMYEVIKNNGANIIGFTSTDGYEYEESKAEVDGKFVGLVIDEDNQPELTDKRINTWIENIKVYL